MKYLFVNRVGERLTSRRFDLNVHTSGQAELVQRFDRLGGCLDDIDDSLVCADLKLLTRLLVDKRTGQDRVSFDSCRQRNRSMHFRIGALSGVHDFLRALIENRMVISFHPDANDFTYGTGHQVYLILRAKNLRPAKLPPGKVPVGGGQASYAAFAGIVETPDGMARRWDRQHGVA